MKAKGVAVIVLTLIAAVLFGAVAQAGGHKNKKPKAKKAPHKIVTKPPKPSKPTKPSKPVINPKSLIPTRYSGQAVAVDLTNMVTFTLADTGPLRPCGGSIEVSVGATNTLTTTNSDVLLSVDGATASVSGVGCVTVSTAEVTNFLAAFVHQGETNSVTNMISFTSASAEARAQCTATGVVLTAMSQIQGLSIDGTNVVVTGETNQLITIDSGSIILNAQMTTLPTNCVCTNCRSGQITVAAVYLMTDSLNGPIAFADAGIKCGSRVPPELRKCDKITGGGFIFITSTNGVTPTNGVVTSTNGVPTNKVCGIRGTFALHADVKNGRRTGRLIFIDHGMRLRVCSTRVAAYTVLDSVSRQIDYDVLINGVPGTARVIAADNGEPGRNDVFDITLSDGYHAGGNLSGGNIQLHTCPPNHRGNGDNDDDDDDDD